MDLYYNLRNKKEKISIIGLGYVGLPLCIEFSKHMDVVGFDINKEKIEMYKDGRDITNEVGDEEVRNSTSEFTCDENKIKDCKFHIIAVPTPVNNDRTPNLSPITDATEIVARNLVKGSIVVYESTVYPGTTEEICIPILEKISGLKHGDDFKVGYSPERINPGDKNIRLTNITKIVSGCDNDSLNTIANVYETIIEAGVYRAPSIKVAEAAKVIENSQRDINIAFMNEISMVFNKMEIDTNEVLKAANTKWNFLDFKPGLVGGHCIGVDPYYFIYKAEELGYHSQIILSGRQINDGMAKHVVDNTIKKLINSNKLVSESKIGILGLTFKENCPDTRNSKVIDIINGLKEYGIEVLVYDPLADKKEALSQYNIDLCDRTALKNLDAIIVSVPHDEFKKFSLDNLLNMYNDTSKILIDVKGLYNINEATKKGIIYWSL